MSLVLVWSDQKLADELEYARRQVVDEVPVAQVIRRHRVEGGQQAARDRGCRWWRA